MSDKCCICELYLTSDITTVKQKGIEKLISTSLAREDGKYALFAGHSELQVHRKCRLLYINDASVTAQVKRNKKTLESCRSNDSVKEFDYENLCFFCAETADFVFVQNQSKLQKSKRIIVSQVTKSTTQQTILQAATTHNDGWSQQVSLFSTSNA